MTTIKAEKISATTGIKLARLDRATLATAAAMIGIDLKKDDTDEQLSEKLYKHYLVGVEGDSDKLLECEHCLGRSPKDIKSCPYCLEDGGGDKSAPDVTKSGKASGSKEATMKTETTRGKTALALVPKAGLLPPDEAAKAQQQLAKYTTKDLDAAVHNVEQLKVKASQGAWELGRALLKISSKQLWKLRVDNKGKPAFKTFEAFVFVECGFTPGHAFKLIKVAEHFTAEDVTRFGTGKLGLVLQAPDEVQPRMLDEVKGGASKATIASAVLEANKGRARTGKGSHARAGEITKAGLPAKKRGRKPGPNAKITVANITGKQTIPLFTAASVKAATGDRKSWVRATKIKDVPTCTMELENGVVQVFTVLEGADGTLKLSIDTHRVDE